MTVSWCLPTQVRDEMLHWCRMPVELYESLAIVHQMAVVEEWHKDVDRVHKEEAGR